MIKKYSLKALQKAINHALALDESMPAKIAALEGKVLEVIVAPLGVNFYIRFDQQQLQLLSDYDGQPDTIIHSSPLGLIRLSFLPASKARSLFNDKIRLSGDVELGQQVKKLFDELDIDWEGHLAHFTGDVVAHQLGSLFRQGIAFKKQLSESMRHNLSDYLQEELGSFPPREEIDDFFSDIDKLSLDVERLQAHVNQLLVKS
ncbi:Putative lipid carrier protein [Legionella massiliensis]|uniref:Ubiquinone biosynthesis accessory factor UbiJ n=1 Tax=Legionella massiliensis TaxID=1034943 RepID=A0A078KNY7_9GAMM|nr:SCP2 sterol-binding domain-containing protein [Legionella massiliensis]CDZ76090.1 Putative lipid carrier protein [Legionella massiliensis]CEE11828.1 SCP-2 sterol transfer family protein [Legionella massiliensis]